MGPSGWEVWTELVIPSLSAVGSLSVAIVAVVITLRLARAEKRERQRALRAEFAVAVEQFVVSVSSERPVGHPRTLSAVHKYRRSLDLAAGRSTEDAPAVARWVVAQARRTGRSPFAGAPGLAIDAWGTFSWEAMSRVLSWVSRGELDDSDLRFVIMGINVDLVNLAQPGAGSASQ